MHSPPECLEGHSAGRRCAWEQCPDQKCLPFLQWRPTETVCLDWEGSIRNVYTTLFRHLVSKCNHVNVPSFWPQSQPLYQPTSWGHCEPAWNTTLVLTNQWPNTNIVRKVKWKQLNSIPDGNPWLWGHVTSWDEGGALGMSPAHLENSQKMRAALEVFPRQGTTWTESQRIPEA